MSKNFIFQNHIDGIRGIAIISVLLYHLDFQIFSGGFIGVDIFFVLSGYLIIPKLIHQIEQGNFKIKLFYLKRVKRIAPMLLLITIITIILGYIILTPREYNELAKCILSILTLSQNFFFRDTSGYFADVAHQKPLLHTWSLGVECQFYLLIPIFLLLVSKIYKQKYKNILFSLIIISSFILSVYWSYNNYADKAFYFPMSRFWEFALGGMIPYFSRNKIIRDNKVLMGYLGFLMILISVWFINMRIIFPGFVILLPAIGTAILIMVGGKKDTIISNILSVKPLTFIGKISYSVYLIHWPIIVFTKLIVSRNLYLTEKISIIIITIILSTLTWFYVESKFINKEIKIRTKVILFYKFIILAIIALISFFIIDKNGIISRMNKPAIKIYNNIDKKIYKATNCLKNIKNITTNASRYTACEVNYSKSGNNIALIGDSHAGMFVDGINSFTEKVNYGFVSFGMPSCYPIINAVAKTKKNQLACREFMQYIKDYIIKNKFNIVVISARWANIASDIPAPGDSGLSYKLINKDGEVTNFRKALSNSVKIFTDLGVKVVIIGPVPEISFHVPDTLIRVNNNIGTLPKTLLKNFYLRQFNVLQTLKNIENNPNVTVVYPHKIMCNNISCDVASKVDGLPLYTDDDHLSDLGVEVLMQDIAKAILNSSE